MKSKQRATRSGLRAVGDAIDVIAVVSGHGEVSSGGLASTIVLMGVAMVGVAIWFGAFIVSGVIIAVFGLGQGPYASLGGAVALAGFFGGLAAAAIVMFRIIRRHRKLVTLSGFADDDASSDDEAPSTPIVAAIAHPGAISGARLREIDARLAAPDGPPALVDEGSDQSPGPI